MIVKWIQFVHSFKDSTTKRQKKSRAEKTPFVVFVSFCARNRGTPAELLSGGGVWFFSWLKSEFPLRKFHVVHCPKPALQVTAGEVHGAVPRLKKSILGFSTSLAGGRESLPPFQKRVTYFFFWETRHSGKGVGHLESKGKLID